MVYKELMFNNVGHRIKCQHYLGNHKHYSNLDCAQILRTNKQVYHETLPIFYSRYTIDMECGECEKKRVIALRSKQLIEHYLEYVKHIVVAYTINHPVPLIRIGEFSTRWSASELQILARYKNTEHVSVQVLGVLFNTIFDLVRRSYKPTIERAHNYKDVLAEHSAYILKNCGTSTLATLEKRCDALVLSDARGPLKDNTFAVHSIRWKPFGEMEEIVLYFGCDKYKTSDAAIETILAKPDREDIGAMEA